MNSTHFRISKNMVCHKIGRNVYYISYYIMAKLVKLVKITPVEHDDLMSNARVVSEVD